MPEYNGTQRDIGRLEGKMDMLIDHVTDIKDQHDTYMPKIEQNATRLADHLEGHKKQNAKVMGGSGVIALTLASVVNFLREHGINI